MKNYNEKTSMEKAAEQFSILTAGLAILGIENEFKIDRFGEENGLHILIDFPDESISIVWNPNSYGYREGLLEAWSFEHGKTFTDEEGNPYGYMTAFEILAKLERKVK